MTSCQRRYRTEPARTPRYASNPTGKPASATVSEHVNEFKRRLEYYCKLRGDKIEDVYKDYQLKGLLLASLHPEAWGEWCRIRQLISADHI